MVKIVTDGDYVPWYSRRAPPVFCFPCLPAYMGIWPARKCVLIIGALLFFFGVIILLAMLLTCIAIECAGVASALIPLALILIIVGILLFHCGYAAHLLDNHGEIPIKKTTTTTTTTVMDPESHEDEIRLFETVHREQVPNVRQGFWQFDENLSWQAASNPYPIQHTLKNCLERQPY
ncbi:uncharacterized protein CELE_W06A7.2 [Caenorhabditis elegans]|uniref:Uncharacterized protein n=1 Tax=Caenorhabditis elegans TaxID=6239 RepID=Q23186_CAEEL|nr:Uncharacterized protein CELE_W06A7.2 [Caenorhabditis elegans]NP_001256625.1 Uncharacterized protein CELE_W06A7.2 [Caenorhabditis elegans]CAB01521.1 Uncharacterized protein CELE_W06A7.2 [Caenorhabditis elegans]CCG28083.1 Uncharacterized protein CELE_W06A7.2 [Caenorhabditis elegans]|eukprot:NP_001256624.1 Uncharacterized protein CELE_W06A7.2 [Caenorhabditis elegans]